MDWTALRLSLQLGGLTVLILIPLALLVGRWLAVTQMRGRSLVEALLALPLVLPPTVLGFYLLAGFGQNSWIGRLWRDLFGGSLVFTFEGLVAASIRLRARTRVTASQRPMRSASGIRMRTVTPPSCSDSRSAVQSIGHIVSPGSTKP